MKDPTSKQLLLSIIVISYNTSQLTLDCLESIQQSQFSQDFSPEDLEIIVVDNHSSDASVAVIENFRRTTSIPLTVIKNTSNVGFAAANNQAILQAKGSYVLLLNSDTHLNPQSLPDLITFAETTDVSVGLLSPHLLNVDGSYQPQGGSFPSLLTVAAQQLFLDDLPLIGRFFPSVQYRYQKNSQVQSIDWVGGTALLIKRSVLTKIGHLDETIFMYAEDIDFCWRAKKAGFSTMLYHPASITHLGSQSSSHSAALVGEVKGLLYFFKKHKPKWQLPLLRWLLLIGAYARTWLFGTIKPDRLRADAYQEVITLLAST